MVFQWAVLIVLLGTAATGNTYSGPKPRQKNIWDLGYPNCGAGWYDVQGQGVKNDYCRWVGMCGCRSERGGGCSWWSCALAGSNVQRSPKGAYTEPDPDGYKDCTEHFKNRVASFEYSYSQGKWLVPVRDNDYLYVGSSSYSVFGIRTATSTQWYLHDCGKGAICAQTRAYENNYYMELDNKNWVYATRDTNLRDGIGGSNKNKHMSIWCQSCEPNHGTYTYNQCQIRFHPEVNSGRQYLLRSYYYTANKLEAFGVSGPDSGPKSYFQFRVELAPTRQYWSVVFDKCNKNVDNLDVSQMFKTSITVEASETYTKSETLKLGLQTAAYLIASIGYEATETYSRTKMQKISEGQEKRISMSVKPGERVIIKQLVGEAGWVTIKTEKFETSKTTC